MYILPFTFVLLEIDILQGKTFIGTYICIYISCVLLRTHVLTCHFLGVNTLLCTIDIKWNIIDSNKKNWHLKDFEKA